MKRYEVLVLPRAMKDLDASYRYIKARAPETAIRWYNGFVRALMSLESNPERCDIAPESAFFPAELRQMFYGKRRNRKYRALFAIAVDEVRVLVIRGPGQRLLAPRDVGLE